MIIFLYGDDSFRSREKLEAIKSKFLEKNSSGSGLSLFDFSEKIQKIDWPNLIGARDLFSPKRLIIIKDLIVSSGLDIQREALEFLKSKKEITGGKDVVIVFWESGRPKENNSLFKYLKSSSKHQEFGVLEGRKLADWVNARIKSIDPSSSIYPRALDKLMAYVGNDLFQMDNEIAKLLNFEERKTIEEKDVDLLVNAKIDSNIFETLDAASCGNKKRALKLLQDQLKKGDDPFYILSMYVYQFRNLLKIGEYFWQGMRNQYEIAKLAKLHPFVVQKGIAQLRNFDFEKLKRIYKKLEEIDLASKSGKVDIKLALDKFVAKI
jgi:DNA polymerase-3 subunit delta